MSTALTDAINEVIGEDDAAHGFRYAVNHSTMPTAGDTAVHDLTINRRVEAPPDEFLMDRSCTAVSPAVGKVE